MRVVASGICHTDLYCHAGLGMPIPRPIVLGHEGAGIVEAVGSGVRELSVGDHVVLSGASCGRCPKCHAGRPTYCRDAMKLSFGGMRGDGSSPLSQHGERVHGMFFAQSSFATQVIAPERSAVKVAKDLPLHLLGPLGCGRAAKQRLEQLPRDAIGKLALELSAARRQDDHALVARPPERGVEQGGLAAPGAALRLFVQGGGCSGLTYGMSFDKQETGDEVAFQDPQLTVVAGPDARHLAPACRQGL